MSDQGRSFSMNTWERLVDLFVDGRLDVKDDAGPTIRKAARRPRDPLSGPLPDPFLRAYHEEGTPVLGFRRGGRLQPHPFIEGLQVSRKCDCVYHGKEVQPRVIRIEETGGRHIEVEVILLTEPTIKIASDWLDPRIESLPILKRTAIPSRLLILETFELDARDPRQTAPDLRAASWKTLAEEVRVALSTPLAGTDDAI